MATRVLNPESRVWQGSTTATTGGTITLDVAAVAGLFNFRDRYANGAIGVPLYLYDNTTGTFEYSYGTLTYGASTILDTVSSRTIVESSNGIGVPIAWGGGTRNAHCEISPKSFLFADNAFAELSDLQASNAVLRLKAGELSTLSGGTDGRAVRYTSSNTLTNAQNTDTNDQLGTLLFKSAGIYYNPGGAVKGLSGLTAGQTYWLGDNTTPLLTAAPTPTTGVRSLKIGKALSTTSLLFTPSQPISG